jgi:hypothetical protein
MSLQSEYNDLAQVLLLLAAELDLIQASYKLRRPKSGLSISIGLGLFGYLDLLECGKMREGGGGRLVTAIES